MRSLIASAMLLSMVSLVGACSSSISKRPARPARPATAQRTPPTPPPRTNVTFPTFECEHPYSEYYCLNKAKCFIVIIQDSRIYNCECPDGFVGQRCEYKDLESSYVLMSRRLMMETASIAGGATVAVFLACLVCAGAWLRLQRRGKELSVESAATVTQVEIGLKPLRPLGSGDYAPC